VIWITPLHDAAGYICRGHGEPDTRQETGMTGPISGIRDLTSDEIRLVSGGTTWAFEIRSADGVLDVGLRLDKTTGREMPYAIWTTAAD
jgi:hypothetical protein